MTPTNSTSSAPSASIPGDFDNISILPREMLAHILQFTDEPTQVSFDLTCRDFRGFKSPNKVPDYCAKAAALGYLNLIIWARENRCPWGKHTFAAAAEFGDIEVLEGLRVNGCPYTWTFDHPPKIGKIEVLKWLLSKGFKMETLISNAAGEIGDIEFIKWLLNHRPPFPAPSIESVIASGKIEVIEWFISKDIFYLDESLFMAAVENGNVEILEWLLDNGCTYDDDESVIGAIGSGQIAVLELLISKNFPLSKQAFACAAGTGNVEVLKCLRKHNCPWDGETFRYAFVYALRTGNIEVLEWVTEHNCPLNGRTFVFALSWAIKTGNAEGLKWIKASLPLEEELFAYVASTADSCVLRGDGAGIEYSVKSLEWLKANGCPWDKRIFDGRCPEILKWLRENLS